MSTIHIATVTATGERFIVITVERPEYPNRKVVTWGHVTTYRDLATEHAGRRVFLLEAVTLDEVEKTPRLIDELLQQYFRSLEAAGKIVDVRTRGARTRYSVTSPVRRAAPVNAELAEAIRAFGDTAEVRALFGKAV